jgi:lysophospholipase L1-like esterase
MRPLLRRRLPAVAPKPSPLPSAGLVADWPMDEGAGQYARNQAGDYPAPLNLFGSPETFDAAAISAWSSVLATLTSSAGADPDGITRAGRYQGSVSTAHSMGQSVSLGAGTYTVSCWVKSNTGSSQTFAMGTTAAASADQTATTSWQRFVYTLSHSGGTVTVTPIRAGAAQTALDLLFFGARLEPGTTAGDYQKMPGHLRLGTKGTPESIDPVWVAGGLDQPTTQYGVAQWTDPVAVANTTFYVAAKWVSGRSPVGGLYCPIVYGNGLTATVSVNGFASGGNSNWVACSWGGTRVDMVPVNMNDGLWHVYAVSYDGTNIKVYIDGVEVRRAAASLAAQSIRSLQYSTVNVNGSWPGTVGSMVYYNVCHDQTSVIARTNEIAARLRARGETALGYLSKLIVWEGDSLTDPNSVLTQNLGHVYKTSRALTSVVQGVSLALGGSTLNSGFGATGAVTDREGRLDLLYDKRRTRHVLCVWIGANDMHSIDGTTMYTRYKAYCQRQRAKGWKVLAYTCTPQTTAVDANFNTRRAVFNPLVQGGWGDFADGLVDLGADATIGPDAAASDTLLYSDGLHLTALGQDSVKALELPVLTSVLA